MSFFDDNFPGVRSMLEAERAKQDAAGVTASANGSPWKVLGMNLGQWTVESSHPTEGEANEALASIHRTCAPFIRNCFKVEYRP